MSYRDKIEFSLAKLSNGNRMMRLTYAPLDLTLEAKLDSQQSVVRQKERLNFLFEKTLANAESSAT
ncbi:MAG: hypothetical protein ACAI35_07350 [Candidatus Methylacidiphilales bacterium]